MRPLLAGKNTRRRGGGWGGLEYEKGGEGGGSKNGSKNMRRRGGGRGGIKDQKEIVRDW